MNKHVSIALISVSMLMASATKCVIFGIKNDSPHTHMAVKVFAKNKHVICEYELSPGESVVASSGFKSIEAIDWHMQHGQYIKTPCYKLKIFIPWYYFFAGMFNLTAGGYYSSTFFGQGQVQGKFCTVHEKISAQNAASATASGK